MSKPPYYPLPALLEWIEEPNRSACQAIMRDNQALFMQAPGSTHNHQAWEGGYWDHVTEVLNIWMLLFGAFERTGRLGHLAPDEVFTLSDGLLVLFLHDIEKPWRCILVDGAPISDGQGGLVVREELKPKAARKAFAEQKIREYGIRLTPAQQNALRYVEGIRDEDYTPDGRVMLPLAALCHTCDLLSARMFYDFPQLSGDPWAQDARRSRIGAMSYMHAADTLAAAVHPGKVRHVRD